MSTCLGAAIETDTYRFVNVDTDVTVADGVADIRTVGTTTRTELPRPFFTANSYAPLVARALLVRYRQRHRQPAHLAVVPGTRARDVRIEHRGDEATRVGGAIINLRQFSMDGIVCGRDTAWLDAADHFAAAIISRIHSLPLEGVRKDLKDSC